MPGSTNIEWPAGDIGARVLGASKYRRGPAAFLVMHSLAVLYRSGVALRNLGYDIGVLRARRARIPVISIGNIVAGGAGKTPFTRWLVGELRARGRTVGILHGGYGSDEPALHRQWHDAELVIEERDRVRGAARAAENGADIIVLDDAFQHRRLARDLDIVLVPAETRARGVLPAGPLREPEGALKRADLVVVTRKTATPEQAAQMAQHVRTRYGKPCAVAALEPARLRAAQEGPTTPPKRVVIVTAIARPDLLVEQVSRLRIAVQHTYAYPDHHDFTAYDVGHILNAAQGMPILTTEKDAIKLLPQMRQADIWILEQRVTIEQGGDALNTMLERVL